MNFDYIYIYQFGKVGSTSLFNHLKKNHKNVIFCHNFNDTYQKNIKDKNKKCLIINIVRNYIHKKIDNNNIIYM